MMDYLRSWPRHAQVVAGITLAVILLVMLQILSSLWVWYADGTRRVEDMEPRIARLHGLAHSEDTLRASGAEVASSLAELTYPAGEAATTGARVQQELRRHLEGAGLSVSGSQVLSAVALEGLEEIRVTLTATGSSEAFDQALLALQEARPLLLVRKLELSPARARRGDTSQTLTTKLDISAVKLL